MDRKIERKTWTTKRILGLTTLSVISLGIIYMVALADRRSKLNVDKERIAISTVTHNTFQEFIPRTGIVQPIKTFYMDAIESGIIEKIVKESGALVEAGDTILVLSNASLELSVLQQENALYGQINTSRRTQVELETRTLNLRDNLVEIDYRLQVLKPQYERYKMLLSKKMISQREFELVEEEYLWNQKRKQLTYTSFIKDSMSVELQLKDLKKQQDRMNQSLKAVGNILSNLIVRSPESGQLSTPELQIGQNVNVGQRLGQVDFIDKFKVRVAIDELYLPRVDIGQKGTFNFDGKRYQITITKIYPTVTDGSFEVDMDFVAQQPEGIKRGQSVRIRLELGSSTVATLLPVGGFYQSTGGNWVYVVDETGKKAVKRNIRIGRKNTEYYEVLEGLQEGEKVVTSSYDYFGDNEVLVIKE